MRFESVQVRRFGCLEDVEIGTETPLPSIVAILGPNESGKSTFFSFLTTLLYGFRPAKRTTNPYTPWLGEDPPEGRACIRLGDGEVQEIHRRLMSVPWGKLKISGRMEGVANKPLPCVAALPHVTREVFAQVYALTLTELSGLEGKSWDLIQEQLVGSMGADLRPAGKIVSEFENEGKKLWRPDKMGKPLYKTLKLKMAVLKDRRLAAQRRDQGLRKKVSELVKAEAKGKALDDERRRLLERQKVKHHRLTILFPVRNKLSQIERLRARAEPRAELTGLPADPPRYLENLRVSKRQAESQIADLARKADDCRGITERERPNVDQLEHRLNVLFPIRNKLSRIEDLRVRAGPSEELEGLPADPPRHLKHLRDSKRQAESQIADLARRADDCRRTIERERPNVDELEHRLNVLLPIRNKLSRIEDLRVRAGPSEELNGLPRDPRGHLERLKADHRSARRQVEKLDGVAVGCQRTIEESRKKQQAVAIVEQQVSAAVDRLADIRRKLNTVDRKTEKLNERSTARARELFSAPWDQIDRSEVSAVPVNELREQVREYQRTRKKRVDAESGGPGDNAHPPGRRRLVGPGFAIVVGGLLSLPSVGVDTPVPLDDAISLALAIGAVIFGGVLGVLWLGRVARANRVRAEWSQRIATLRSEEEAEKDGVGRLAGELPIKTWLLEPANFNHLVERFRRMVDLSNDLAENQRVAACWRAKLDDETTALTEMVAEKIGRLAETTTVSVHEDLVAQAGALQEATRIIQRKIDVDKMALARAEADVRKARDKWRDTASGLRTLEGTLANFGDGSVDRGLDEVVERLGARNRASELRAELERDRPDLDDLVAQIDEAEDDGEPWETLSERLRAAREARDEAKTAQGKLENIESLLATAERQRDTLVSKLHAFTKTLASFGGGDADRGLDEIVERLGARNRASELRAELERDRPDLDDLVAQIDEVEDDGEPWETLSERLRTAREARDEAMTAQGTLENVESQLATAKQGRDTLAMKLRAFTRVLASFGDGSVDHGLDQVVARLEARDRACQLRTELERDYSDLEEVVAQIDDAEANGERWDSLSSDLAVIDARVRVLNDDRGEQNELVGRLKSEVEHIQREETADQVQGEIELVKDQMVGARESRDRRFLLAKLVQEADRRFREEHQPALLKHAGKYVDQITGGRYDRIVIGEAGEKFFSLRDPANSQLRKMSDPFSQGIKEQVYFALRLAAIDHLDADKERLPLFLDEVFVNWDPQRLDRAFRLVKQVARQRQVFFFTCHEAMALKLQDAGGKVIDLV